MFRMKFSRLFIFLSVGFFSSIVYGQPLDKDVLDTALRPAARWGHVFIYNPVYKHILLFGGSGSRGGAFFDDTWIWEDEKWKQLDIPGPSARGFCAVAFHKKRKTIILHGGRGNDGIINSDMWEWDGKQWVQIESESMYQSDHHQMVYLKEQNALLVYGGWNGKQVLGDTWMWSGDWKKLDALSPPKRSAFGMVYNAKTNAVNLYGGLWINGQYADLWEWADGNWKSQSQPYDNSSLDHHALIYDANLEKIIGFWWQELQISRSTKYVSNRRWQRHHHQQRRTTSSTQFWLHL